MVGVGKVEAGFAAERCSSLSPNPKHPNPNLDVLRPSVFDRSQDRRIPLREFEDLFAGRPLRQTLDPKPGILNPESWTLNPDP